MAIRIIIVSVSLIMASALFFPVGAQKVLIVESYHPTLEWTVQCEKGIRSALGSTVAIVPFYMDTKRIPESDFRKKANLAFHTYLKEKPDLVMLGDDDALRLVGPMLAGKGTPLVYFGINDNPRNYFDKLPFNMTGVLERTPVIPWLRYLRQIFPDARRALVLFDESVTSQAIVDVVFQSKTSISIDGMNVDYKMTGTFREWKNIVKNTGSYQILLMPTFHSIKSDTGAPVSINAVIEWTSANTPVPVFTNQDYTVSDTGVIGAYVIYGLNHGRMAGEIARSILLDNTPVQDIPPKTDREGRFYFNRKQMERFGITLPESIKNTAVFK
jgi:ABC-type uncharacterized transport system substrate-binding protein